MSAAPLVLTTDRAGETRALGERLGALLRPGDVLLLDGPLGAGKTTLAQGIGAALRVPGHVTSPTFVLVQQHESAVPLFHADLYRLDDPLEVDELALEDQARHGILLVEWPERGAEALPPEHLWVAIALDPQDPERRTIELRPAGERAEELVRQMRAAA